MLASYQIKHSISGIRNLDRDTVCARAHTHTRARAYTYKHAFLGDSYLIGVRDDYEDQGNNSYLRVYKNAEYTTLSLRCTKRHRSVNRCAKIDLSIRDN